MTSQWVIYKKYKTINITVIQRENNGASSCGGNDWERRERTNAANAMAAVVAAERTFLPRGTGAVGGAGHE